MKSENRITMQTLAEYFNVSVVTISKALRDHPDISAATKRKIKEKAAELGYTPNYFAKHLSARRTNIIGVVIPKIAHYFFSTIVQSIQENALHKKFEIVLMVSHESSELQEKNLRTLMSMKVDGIIISVTQDSLQSDVYNQIRNSKIPLVFIDRTLNYNGFSSVTVDDYHGSKKLINFAIERGYKKIAHFGGPQNSSIGLDRYLGYKCALESAGIEVNENWVKFLGFSEDVGYQGFKEIMKQEKLPDLIYAVTYPVAMGIMQAALEMEINIPNSMNLVCFGGSAFNELLSTPITCMKQPASELGTKAFELLVREINATDLFITQNEKLDTELFIGKTCIIRNRREN